MKPPTNPTRSQLREIGQFRPDISLEDLATATSATVSRADRARELRRFVRKESAATALSGFSQAVDVVGITKGQFSLAELIAAALEKTGPAALTLSTWTAANADLADVEQLLKAGAITRARFLIDLTLQRRFPAIAQTMRDRFGVRSIRITRNHSKFFQLHAPERGWTVTCKTSMNLNTNPRLENFDITNEPGTFAFFDRFVSDIFEQTDPELQNRQSTTELQRDFLQNIGAEAKP